MSGNKEILEPGAKKALNDIKLEVANETLGRDMNQPITATNYESALDRKKWEAAESLGLKEKVESVGWENMTTGEVGQIGGRTGGKIGGQMVKELIARAEEQMAPVADEAIDKKAIEAGPRG
ncbi:MAG: small, acid-soluble spore protein, alpha/beta type [Negativicutes bacterium]|nr:small, acid-soluble spore protein, alpha/beta type [Negativicutes bacterium]